MKEMGKIASAILCIALTLIGFEYDSTWVFIGAFICFINVVD